MNGKELATALARRQRVYGTAILSDSPQWAAAVGGAGLDFLFIDTEHIPIDRTTLSWMCRAFEAMDLAPVVRIPAPDPYQACMVLDGGAMGVLAPYIESPEQVEQLRAAVRFRPLKGERVKRALRDPSELEPELAIYLETRNQPRSLLLNIESVPAIEALDEILSVPDIGAIVIGPHDLSCSLGVPEQYDHKRFKDAVATIFGKCADRGVSAGIHVFWGGVEEHVEWARAGGNVILHGADLILFRGALVEKVTRIRQALGDAESGNSDYLPV